MRGSRKAARAVSTAPDGSDEISGKYRAVIKKASRINRKRYSGVEDTDCVSFYRDKGGSACCSALNAPYCMDGSGSCSFQITYAKAAQGRFTANASRLAPHL